MKRLIGAFAAGIALLPALAFAPSASAQQPGAEAQTPTYEYEVLPGLQPAGPDPVDLQMTQGWHASAGGRPGSPALAIDIGGASNSTVYASFRAVTPNAGIRAVVAFVVDSGPDCRTVHVRFYREHSDEPLGRAIYTHVLPDVSIDDAIPVATGRGTSLGRLAVASWVPVRTTATQAEINRRVDDPADSFAADGIGAVGAVQHVTLSGVQYTVRQMFGQDTRTGWYEQRWHGVSPPGNADGASCPTTGAHLHQAATLGASDSLWRNLDRPGRPDDDGMGFPGKTSFCSGTWIFKLYPPPPSGQSLNEWAPMASPVEPCGAPDNAPANLAATAGDGQIALMWNDPSDTTITRYEVRSRVSSATSQGAWGPISGSGATTTSHALTPLTNGTEYTVQVRAVNASGNGPPSTVSATPKAPPPLPPRPTGAACLAHSGVNTYTSWRQECASSSAAALLVALSSDVCGIWLWVQSTSSWLSYVETSAGVLAPGSVNFTISPGDILWIGGCGPGRDGATGPPGPPPKDLTS